jgi:hypothetical protein
VKKQILGWLMISVFIFMGSLLTTAKTIGVIYTYQPVNIDGQMDEWIQIKRYQAYSGNVEYSFKIDNQNLYILFVFRSPKLLSTFSSSGMKIFLFNSRGGSRELGVHFIKKTLSPGQMVELLEKRYGPIPDDKRREIYNRSEYHIYQNRVIREDRKETASIRLNARESCTFKIAQVPPESMVAEFRIPHTVLREILGKEQLPDEMRLIFEWGGMTAEMYNQQLKMQQAQSHQESTQEERISSITEDRDGVDQPYAYYGSENIGPKKYTIKLKLGLPVDKISPES